MSPEESENKPDLTLFAIGSVFLLSLLVYGYIEGLAIDAKRFGPGYNKRNTPTPALALSQTPQSELAAKNRGRNSQATQTPIPVAAETTPVVAPLGSEMTISGVTLVCGEINNDENSTYDRSKPVARNGIDVLNHIGVPGIDKPPYLIMVNGQVLMAIHTLNDDRWHHMVDGDGVCVVKQN